MGDRIADPTELRIMATVGCLLLVNWCFAIFLPLMIAGFVARLDPWMWFLVTGLFAYFGYTGIRARRRGWKSRFILRVIVPVVLLVISSALTIVVALGRS